MGFQEGWTAAARQLEALAKANGTAAVAADSIDHLRRYIELLFAAGEPAREHPR